MPVNDLFLSFGGLSVKDPYKSQLKLTFNGLSVPTQKQSALKFWGLTPKDADRSKLNYQII